MSRANHISWSISELCALLVSEMDRQGIPGTRGSRGREATIRNIPYYVYLGILDRPTGYRLGEPLFGTRHLSQLLAIRALQARRMPLNRIRSCVRGLNPAELGAIVEACVKARQAARTTGESPLPEIHTEVWMEDRGTFLDWLQIYHSPALFTAAAVVPLPGVN